MAAPAVRVIAERKVAQHFIAAGATSIADAIGYTPTRLGHARAFERLKGADVLKTDGRGHWYLDEAQWQRRRSSRRARVVLTMLAVAAAGAFAALR
ncbi:MAG: hypothetical protein OHK0018_16290 [Erythrobacter tepidarius]